MAIIDSLGAIVTALAGITGVTTSKIGLEPNMTPADYPIVRVVPSRVSPFEVSGLRKVELLIYYGAPLQAFDGMDAVYGELLRLEGEIVGVLESGPWRASHKDTITDEDRLTTYKLFMSRFEVMV